MTDFESFVALLLAAVVLAGMARRWKVPYPAFLALGGALLAFIPGAPRFVLRPIWRWRCSCAPVLLDAAYDTSTRDLRDNWGPITGLVLVAVGLTTAAVAVVVHALVPGMPWAPAIALGALVAPPDAAAATAVLRQARPPQRILTILEGESLLNDASALLIYRLAVGAVAANAFVARSVVPTFLFAIAGSLIVGPVLAVITLRLTRRVTDVPSAIILQFVSTFGVWILADRIGLSGVLTMVCYAITVARSAPARTPARIRVPSYAVWDTIVFLSNVLAFILIGLQIRPIIENLPGRDRLRYLVVAGAVLATVIVVRFAWVMSYNAVTRLKVRRYGFHPPRPMLAPTVRGGLIVSWCGMRGVVTLAAALALPTMANGAAFPFHDLIVLTAFCVVLGTLVIQGITLRPLLRRLDLRDDDPVGREVGLARAAALRAALSSVSDNRSPEADAVRVEYQTLLSPSDGAGVREPAAALGHAELRRRALVSARRAVAELKVKKEIGDDAFHQLEEQLDWVEMSNPPDQR